MSFSCLFHVSLNLLLHSPANVFGTNFCHHNHHRVSLESPIKPQPPSQVKRSHYDRSRPRSKTYRACLCGCFMSPWWTVFQWLFMAFFLANPISLCAPPWLPGFKSSKHQGEQNPTSQLSRSTLRAMLKTESIRDHILGTHTCNAQWV